MTTLSSYRLQKVPLNEATDFLPQWAQLAGALRPTTVHFPHADWLHACFPDNAADLSLAVLRDGPDAVGFAALLACRWPLTYEMGGIALGTRRLRCLRLLGGVASLPEDPQACTFLLSELLRSSGGRVLYLENVPVDSILWQHAGHGAEAAALRRYCLRGPSPRFYLRIKGSFEQYLGHFSPKTRRNRVRKAKRLQEAAKTDVVKITAPEDVDAFIDAAVTVSRRTYQYLELGLGINDAAAFRRRLKLAARHGWLRSYLLTCNGTPAAFVIGFQYNQTYYYANLGFEPEWSRFSIGAFLLFEILRDLHGENRPLAVDFGTGGGYKEYYSTGSYLEVDAVVHEPDPRVTGAFAVHRACRLLSRQGASLLDRLHLKDTLKRALRRD